MSDDTRSNGISPYSHAGVAYGDTAVSTVRQEVDDITKHQANAVQSHFGDQADTATGPSLPPVEGHTDDGSDSGYGDASEEGRHIEIDSDFERDSIAPGPRVFFDEHHAHARKQALATGSSQEAVHGGEGKGKEPAFSVKQSDTYSTQPGRSEGGTRATTGMEQIDYEEPHEQTRPSLDGAVRDLLSCVPCGTAAQRRGKQAGSSRGSR